jgi:uncharacterized protein with HEPN domain
MLPVDRDAALLWDMLRACQEIRGFTRGVVWEDFIADRKLCLAVERCLEIVGEAAGRISKPFCSAHPEIPWRFITGMRNVLAHDYGQIEYEIIYGTVTKSVPSLLATLELMLPGPRNP